MQEDILGCLQAYTWWALRPKWLSCDSDAFTTLRRDLLFVLSGVRNAVLVDYGAFNLKSVSRYVSSLQESVPATRALSLLQLDDFLFILNRSQVFEALKSVCKSEDRMIALIDASSHLPAPALVMGAPRRIVWEKFIVPACEKIVEALEGSEVQTELNLDCGALIVTLTAILLDYGAAYICRDASGSFLNASGNCLANATLSLFWKTSQINPKLSSSRSAQLRSLFVPPAGSQYASMILDKNEAYVTSWTIPAALLPTIADTSTHQLEDNAPTFDSSLWQSVNVRSISVQLPRVMI